MKTVKQILKLLALVAFLGNVAYAQDEQPTMFNVHTDNVNFNKIQEYEGLAKQLKDNCVKHNIQGVSWTTYSMADGRYVYVSALEKMADLDNNIFKELFDKMGKEAAAAMFDKMDECYDSHGNSIVHYIPELSYNPEGYSSKGKNFREYHFLYYAPKDAKAMREAMKGVKDMFAAKGIKNGYSVLHSGFGSEQNYYMVAISGEDDVEIAQGGKENDEMMGDEGQNTMFNVIQLVTKYDLVKGRMRPDLSYAPSTN